MRLLIVDTKGGLCSRLLGMAAGLRLAEVSEREAVIGTWAKTRVFDKWFEMPPDQVFRLPLRRASGDEKRRAGQRVAPRWRWPGDHHLKVKGGKTAVWFELCVPCYDVTENRKIISPEAGWDPMRHRDTGEYLRTILPAAEIQDKVQRVCDEFEIHPKRFVGVHVRRGDHKIARAKSPDHKFVSRLRQELAKDSSVEFFLCTDDLEVEATLRKQFPGKITTLPKRSLDRSRIEATQDAFVDLIALSRSRRLLGSFGSSFAFTAALLGDVPLSHVL